MSEARQRRVDPASTHLGPRPPAASTPRDQGVPAGGAAPAATAKAAPMPRRLRRRARPGRPTNAADGARPEDRSAAPSPRSRPVRAAAAEPQSGPEHQVLRGAAARTVANMDISLTVPTATSVRSLPVKLLIDNRIVINNHLSRARGGKVSFTHIIGYAIVQALKAMPEMNYGFEEIDGKPNVVKPAHINLGLAIDLQKPDGSRQLLVPAIKGAEDMGFAEFWAAYEDVVRRARDNKLTVADFQGTSVSLTNPGTIGTSHSVPRLMSGQGAIIGVGAMNYPPEWQGASVETIARNAVSKVMTLTSTYDHRVIQGAQSGDFLRRIHALLIGEEGFYDAIFRALRIPYEPIRWAPDISASHEDEISKQARILELIHAYRVRGHIMADTDPLEYKQRSHPDLDIGTHGLTLWDLDREFASGSFGTERFMKLRHILGILRDSYCRTTGIEYMHIQDPEQRKWIQERVERPHSKTPRDEQLRILHKLNQAEAFETFLQTKFVGQKRFSLEGAETTVPLLDEICEAAADNGLDEVCIGMAHRGRLNVLTNIVGKSYANVFREFEGNIDPNTVQGSGDVKYHLGRRGRVHLRQRQQHPGVRGGQPVAPRGGGPGARGHRPRQAGPAEQGRRLPGAPAARPRRRGVRRAGRRGGDAQPLPAEGLPHRRHHPRGRQQPGRLHHVAVVVALVALLHRRGPDGPGADLPRQRRRPGGMHPGGAARLRVPPGVQQGRRHRPGLLPPTRPQRGRRPVVHAAADVRPDREEALRTAPLHRGADRAWRHHPRRGRVGDEGLPEAAGGRLHRGARGDQPERRVPDRAGVPGEGCRRGHAPTAPSRPRCSSASPTRTCRSRTGFTVHPKVLPQLQRRAAAITEGPIDWGTGEILAFGSLLMQGRPVRLSGQDSRRGTFVSRFATVIDRVTAEEWTPLANLTDDQASFHVYDSLLSRVRRAGLRVRLLGGPTGGADPVGGPVRRLRQRGPDDHRRVHRRRRGQVAAAVRRRAAAPPRVRGAGAGPLVLADRAVPDARRRRRVHGRAAVHAGELLPPAARALPGQHPPADGRVHAEVDAEAQGRGVGPGGLHVGHVPSR